jgi:predicted nucleic acid-binding protein
VAAGTAGHQEGVSSDIAVFDASPLILFSQVGYFEMLRDVFSEIFVPTAVALEVAPSLGRLPTWIDERPVRTTRPLPRKLGAGEREAITLATQLAANYVVLDDLPARRVAANLGLTVVGSLGLLVRARDHGLIARVRLIMDQMIARGLFATEQLYQEILTAAGEAD